MGNILFLIGLALILGVFGGRIFKFFRIPQVVGYILIGIVIGRGGFNFWPESFTLSLSPLIQFILGIIGFMIGMELKAEVFKRYGRTIYTILLSEGLAAFLFVTGVVFLFTRDIYLGLLLGAVASATDPASTVNVLWEYKSRGPLTTTLTSIVALDDALALILYSFSIMFCKSMLGKEVFSLWHSIAAPLWEIFQSCVIGGTAGLLLAWVVKKFQEEDLILAFCFGGILSVVGASIVLNLDLIISSMVMGLVLVNMLPGLSERLFLKIKSLSAPLYVLFFIFIGAELKMSVFLQTTVIIVVLGYLFARSFGKIFGAIIGAWVSRAKKNVVRYTGISLFTQGGVAIGLAMSISHTLGSAGEQGRVLGSTIIAVVAATTIVVQLIGPVLVKIAISKAGEAGKNITEEDVIDSLRVGDVMIKDFPSIKENANLGQIMEVIKNTNVYHYPVVTDSGRLVGIISLGSLRSAFLEEDLNSLIVAEDVAEPPADILYQQQPLKDSRYIFEKRNVDFLPVVEKKGSLNLVGVLHSRLLRDTVHRKLVEIQTNLDS